MNIGPLRAGPDTGRRPEGSQIAERIVAFVSFGIDAGSVVVDIPLTAHRGWSVSSWARDG